MPQIPSAEQSVNRIVADLHAISASHMPVSVGIGQVLNPPPDLKIVWNNIILEKEQLYIDQFLLPNYQRSLKGKETMPTAKGDIKTNTQTRRGGHDKPRYTSHSHKINDSYKASVEGDYTASAIYTDCGLTVGDLVSIIPLEGAQKFLVLGKVVYLPEFDFSVKGENGETSGLIN